MAVLLKIVGWVLGVLDLLLALVFVAICKDDLQAGDACSVAFSLFLIALLLASALYLFRVLKKPLVNYILSGFNVMLFFLCLLIYPELEAEGDGFFGGGFLLFFAGNVIAHILIGRRNAKLPPKTEATRVEQLFG